MSSTELTKQKEQWTVLNEPLITGNARSIISVDQGTVAVEEVS